MWTLRPKKMSLHFHKCEFRGDVFSQVIIDITSACFIVGVGIFFLPVRSQINSLRLLHIV